jgi:hypothetical protein
VRTATVRVGYIPCPVARPKLYLAPHKRPFLRRSATRLGWTPLEASQATGAHPLATPQRPLKAGWDLLTHAQDRHGQGFSTPFFSSPGNATKGSAGSIAGSIHLQRNGVAAAIVGLQSLGPGPAWHVRVRLRLDRSGRGWSTKTRATHELAMPLFSFPRILRFERHAVLRPLLWASSQVQLRHLSLANLLFLSLPSFSVREKENSFLRLGLAARV